MKKSLYRSLAEKFEYMGGSDEEGDISNKENSGATHPGVKALPEECGRNGEKLTLGHLLSLENGKGCMLVDLEKDGDALPPLSVGTYNGSPFEALSSGEKTQTGSDEEDKVLPLQRIGDSISPSKF